ncbi:MAG: SMC family ATPase [Bacilli bacterium]|nr:SMC family ATPase [Bacilli bacterium]
MKLINLKISAFGPYKDEVDIDFTKFNDCGIFLITGDTGSGKTTIFDAICFALFGVASGSNRLKSSFRSDFASSDRKTFVKLIFLHKGIKYEIERSPSYIRKKLRGEGYTQVSGDANLVYLDKVVTGDANVTNECVSILGMSSSQFKQISMLAQGEFLKLLLAKPGDRADIFRKIFDTYIYKDISEKFKKKFLEQKHEYETIKINIDSLRDNLILDDDISDLNISDLLLFIDKFTKKDEIILSDLEDKKNDLLKSIQKIVTEIDNSNLINDRIAKFNEVIKELDNKFSIRCIIDEKKVLIDKNRMIKERIVPLLTKRNTIKETLKEKEKQFKDTKAELFRINSNYKVLKEKYDNIHLLQDNINNKRLELEKLELKVPVFEEIKELKKVLDANNNIYNLLLLGNYNKIMDKYTNVELLKSKYKLLETDFKKLKNNYNRLSGQYNRDYNLFINCQAGIIAEGLEENVPCPVCGSLEHPKLAKLGKKHINKDELDNEYVTLMKKQKELELSSNNLSSLKKELDYKMKEVSDYDYVDIKNSVNLCKKSIKKNMDVSKYKIDDVKADINYNKALIDSKVKEVDDVVEEDLKRRIKELKVIVDKLLFDLEKTINEYNIVNDKKIKLESVAENLEKDINRLIKESGIIEKKYIKLYTELGYSSEEDYLKIKLSDDIFNLYISEVDKYEKELIELNKEKQILEDFIKGKKVVDTSLYVKKKQKLDNDYNDVEMSLKIVSNRLNNNKMIYKKIKKRFSDIKETEKLLSMYEDLSNTANGNIKGRNKLEFEQYVQVGYFDKMIISANKRFSYMTDSRYLLMRKKESNKISDTLGLELEVFDNYTGKKREITSLSGGESFKASLSLALGISDIIQSYAGGIAIDVMFIDEGFGSLDSDSLDSAISAILKLSDNNKLVGIISHVNELKDRIDKKIIVKKSNRGSIVDIVV